MKKIHQLSSGKRDSRKEEGMAMLITLMMGLALLAGSGGLISRLVMGRKIGSSESYQQMAETAALNGFNRILATFNKDDDENYDEDDAEQLHPEVLRVRHVSREGIIFSLSVDMSNSTRRSFACLLVAHQ